MIATQAAETRSPAPTVRLVPAERRVELLDERLFGGPEDLLGRFLVRVLAIDGVRGVEVDRAGATASILYRVPPAELPALLSRLAAALRDDQAPRRPLAMPRSARGERFALFRHGDVLSAWRVVHDGPGRLRLRHPDLRRDHERAERVASALAEVPGVRRARAGSWSGSLLLIYDAEALGVARLLRMAEEALEEPAPWGRLPAAEPVRFGLANTTVGIAALGQLALPILTPVSAALLIGTSAGTVKAAWKELKARRLGLPVLYTAIVGTTLATGQFLSAAIMYWFFRFWNRRYRRTLAAERRRLLDECLPRPEIARLLTPSGTEVLVPPDRLGPGDRIVVGRGEVVPADARVLVGEATVEESTLTGTAGASRKRPGATLLAGSVVLDGEVQAAVEQLGDTTRAAALSRALISATVAVPGARAPTRQAEAFAERTVGPTLTVAGFGGLLAGDLATAGAILRPDYATGPGLAVPLEVLRDVERCLGEGILVREPAALERLLHVDLLVIEDGPALRRFGLVVDKVQTRMDEALLFQLAASAFQHLADPRAAALTAACRERGGHLVQTEPTALSEGVSVAYKGRRICVREAGPGQAVDGPLRIEIDDTVVGLVGFRTGSSLAAAGALERLRADVPRLRFALVSDRPQNELEPLAIGLGVESAHGGVDAEGAARFLRFCRESGLSAAFVGDVRVHDRAAAEASVAIDTGGDLDATAAVHLLGGRLDGLDALWRIAGEHVRQVRTDHLGVVLPNLLCVAGAFLFGFTGMHSVMISNLGTYGTYTRATAAMRWARSRRNPARPVEPGRASPP